MSDSLKSNTTLTELDLAMCSSGDSGVSALSDALKSNSTLTTLNLRCEERIGYVSSTTYDMSRRQDNIYISLDSTVALLRALKRNTTITSLLLGNGYLVGDIESELTRNSGNSLSYILFA